MPHAARGRGLHRLSWWPQPRRGGQRGHPRAGSPMRSGHTTTVWRPGHWPPMDCAPPPRGDVVAPDSDRSGASNRDPGHALRWCVWSPTCRVRKPPIACTWRSPAARPRYDIVVSGITTRHSGRRRHLQRDLAAAMEAGSLCQRRWYHWPPRDTGRPLRHAPRRGRIGARSRPIRFGRHLLHVNVNDLQWDALAGSRLVAWATASRPARRPMMTARPPWWWIGTGPKEPGPGTFPASAAGTARSRRSTST